MCKASSSSRSEACERLAVFLRELLETGIVTIVKRRLVIGLR
jgi:hypothetical protein